MKKTIFLFVFFAIMLTACMDNKQTPEEEIQACLDRADEYFEQKNYSLLEIELAKALIQSKKQFGEQSKENAYILLEIALYNSLDEAIENVKKAEAIFNNSEDMGGLSKAYYTYGRVYDRKSESDLSKSAYEEALKYCDMSVEDMGALKYEIYFCLAGLDNSSYEESLNYCKNAEVLLDKLPKEEKNKEKIRLYQSIGNCYYGLAQNDLAIENYEKVIDCWNHYEEGDRLTIAQCYNYCGYRYAIVGNFDKAIEYINQSLVMLKDIKEAQLWDYAFAYWHLCDVYTADEIQDYEKSMDYGIKACQIYTKQKELSVQELEELKSYKEELKKIYEESPMAEQQDFESWYKENINRQSLKE